MIYKTDSGEFVISSHHIWLPGCFENERTAKYAFRFPDAQLRLLQDKKNETSSVITFSDLQELRKSINNSKLKNEKTDEI